MSYQVLSAQQWAQREFGSVQLNDRRLNRRVVSVAWAMAGHPSGSLPQQNRAWKQIKGAYRLFDHERVNFQSLSRPHWDQTRSDAGEKPVCLMIQDTTPLSFSHHPATAGLGHLRCKKQRGLLLHSVLAVVPQSQSQAQVLGLAWGKLWTRDDVAPEPGQSLNQKRHRRRTSDDRESLRWIEAMEQIGSAPEGCRWIHVGDREADLFDLFEQSAQQSNVGFIVRLHHGRGAIAGHVHEVLTSSQRPQSSLPEVCRAMKQLTGKRLWIAPRGGRAGRWAELAISAGPVTIYSPWFGPKGSRTARPLCCWAVRVWEIDPPKGTEPIEWMLISSEPINSAADALRIVEYYSLRWLIEEYHQCLKSGCKVEDRQLESADRLAPLIGMLAITATRILQLKNDARIDPDQPARQCVDEDQLKTMAQKLKANPNTLTVRRFVHEVAKLGGFIGRKRDGQPGWLTLWRGWQELTVLTQGYQLAMEALRCG